MRNIKKKQAKIIEKVREEFSEDALKELKKEGIPEHIIYSFMQSAKETSSTVLSRVPGGAGLDLIEDGYDLKSFHIKAKSCDWGPMAGFICQIPVLNKKGYSNLDYNTNEIAAYLKHLDKFNPTGDSIKKLELLKSRVLKKILVYFKKGILIEIKDRGNKVKKHQILPIEDEKPFLENILKKIAEKNNKIIGKKEKKEIKRNIIRVFDEEILALLRPKRKDEIITGDWTGENTIKDKLPFITLKRNFGKKSKDALEKVKTLKGVYDAKIGRKERKTDWIIGTARNKKEKKEASVEIDFLLRKKDKESSCWEILHGNIHFQNEKQEWTHFNDQTIKNLSKKNRKKYKAQDDGKNYLEKIFSFHKDSIEYPLKDDSTEKDDSTKKYYPLNGFVNPHPPFPKEIESPNPDYYKNAVTGDYDLFAIWPKMTINPDELIRKSEFSIGKPLRMGGKILTQYLGNKCNFGIEFIPGFAELNANASKDENKKEDRRNIAHEFQDYGNPHSWEMLVCGYLNSFASEYSGRSVPEGNKAFHSDEGGRPGIMEVEFPIAVFFPNKFKSKALNNYVNKKGSINPLNQRTEIEVYGGLIKSADELVALALELMQADFRIFFHNRWVMHLLYLSFDSTKNIRVNKLKDILEKGIALGKEEKFDINQDFKEFDAIDKAKAEFDINYNPAVITANYNYFLEGLKELLIANYDIDNQVTAADFFVSFRIAMLTHFFQDKKLALDKKEEIIEIMRANPIDYGTIIKKIV
jgi:hypothetical protein